MWIKLYVRFRLRWPLTSSFSFDRTRHCGRKCSKSSIGHLTSPLRCKSWQLWSRLSVSSARYSPSSLRRAASLESSGEEAQSQDLVPDQVVLLAPRSRPIESQPVMIFVVNRRSFGWTLQMQVEPEPFLQALLIALSAALLAGIYPAFRISQKITADAIRFE